MDTDARQHLHATIRALLTVVRQHLAKPAPQYAEPIDGIDALLDDVNTAGRVAAEAAGYLRVRYKNAKATPPSWGRELTKYDLSRFGVDVFLGANRNDADLERVVADLAGYLAGPAVPCEDLVVIDARLPLTDTHSVAGWQLMLADDNVLNALNPLPSTYEFADDRWDAALTHGGCAVLRRPKTAIVPGTGNTTLFEGIAADLLEPELTFVAWAPLLLINLAANERVISVAEYETEPGRWVHRVRGDGVTLTETGDDDNEPVRYVPAWGPYQPSPEETSELLQTINMLTPLLEAFTPAPGASKAQKLPEARIRRCAHRFLAQGPRLGQGGDAVLSRDRAELLFMFVSALENLVVTEEKGGGDLNRKLLQRTAMLIGTNDQDRIEISSTLKSAYTLRSSFAHGDAIRLDQLQFLLPRLYGYLREALRALIILGPGFDVAGDCDQALLSTAARKKITEAVTAVTASLPPAQRSLRAEAYEERHRQRLRALGVQAERR